MIPDMRLRPKAQNENGKRVFLYTLILSVLVFVISLFLESYQGVVQLVSLVGITVSLYFYNRYVATVYEYELTTDADGTPLFVVSSKTAKRVSALCRIALWDVSDITRLSREERKAHKTPVDMAKHVYAPTLSPDSITRITVRSRYEKCEIYIEATEPFEDYLRSVVAEARLGRPAFDDE